MLMFLIPKLNDTELPKYLAKMAFSIASAEQCVERNCYVDTRICGGYIADAMPTKISSTKGISICSQA